MTNNNPKDEIFGLLKDVEKNFEDRIFEIIHRSKSHKIPPTSTLGDNNEALSYIEEIKTKIRKLTFKENRIPPLNSSLDINKIIGCDSYKSGNCNVYTLPEAIKNIIIDGLEQLVSINENNPNEATYNINLLPSDQELDSREKDVFDKFKLDARDKEVSKWFVTFFGPKASMVRERWQRYVFVLFLEDELRKQSL